MQTSNEVLGWPMFLSVIGRTFFRLKFRVAPTEIRQPNRKLPRGSFCDVSHSLRSGTPSDKQTEPLSFHVLSRTHNDRIKDRAIKVLRAAASDN